MEQNVASTTCPTRSSSRRVARWQDRLNRPWSWYACGCQCNRDTVASIGAASFRLRDLRSDRLRWISPVVRPLVVGAATPVREERVADMHSGVDIAESSVAAGSARA